MIVTSSAELNGLVHMKLFDIYKKQYQLFLSITPMSYINAAPLEQENIYKICNLDSQSGF